VRYKCHVKEYIQIYGKILNRFSDGWKANMKMCCCNWKKRMILHLNGNKLQKIFVFIGCSNWSVKTKLLMPWRIKIRAI
jgi:hypothetical protein